MKKLMIFLIWLLFINVNASKAIVIGFDPVDQDVLWGKKVSVKLFISGLGNGVAPSLSTFDLDIHFDPTILSFDSATFGDPSLGNQLDIWGLGSNPQGASIIRPGVLDIWELSLDTANDLNTFQASDFVLATLIFNTLAIGTSSLEIVIDALGDAKGNSIAANIKNGNVNVIPEPSTILLLIIGLTSTEFIRRKFL